MEIEVAGSESRGKALMNAGHSSRMLFKFNKKPGYLLSSPRSPQPHSTLLHSAFFPWEADLYGLYQWVSLPCGFWLGSAIGTPHPSHPEPHRQQIRGKDKHEVRYWIPQLLLQWAACTAGQVRVSFKECPQITYLNVPSFSCQALTDNIVRIQREESYGESRKTSQRKWTL